MGWHQSPHLPSLRGAVPISSAPQVLSPVAQLCSAQGQPHQDPLWQPRVMVVLPTVDVDSPSRSMSSTGTGVPALAPDSWPPPGPAPPWRWPPLLTILGQKNEKPVAACPAVTRHLMNG